MVMVANIIPAAFLNGERLTKHVAEYYKEPGGARLRLLRVPLAGGKVEVIYEEDGVRSGHVQYNPKDHDLLLFDRDFPPRILNQPPQGILYHSMQPKEVAAMFML